MCFMVHSRVECLFLFSFPFFSPLLIHYRTEHEKLQYKMSTEKPTHLLDREVHNGWILL